MKKILLTIGIISLTLLSGCESKNAAKDFTQHPLVQAIGQQFNVKREVEIFAAAEEKGSSIVVTITLHNVNQKPITSAQTWLTYNPEQLKGKSIKTEHSPFKLTAPYENNFDEKLGLIRIGRANNEPIRDARIDIAQVVFEKQTDDTAMINFYDYQSYLTGHTSVNMMLNGKPYNILKKPSTPAVVIR